MKAHLTHTHVEDLAKDLAVAIQKQFPQETFLKGYAIPRGGIPVLYLLTNFDPRIQIAENPFDADFFVDDLIDSGSTMQEWCDEYPGKPFFALIDKTDPACNFKDVWIIFPWESSFRSEDDTVVGTITNRLKSKGVDFFANDNISTHLLPGEMDLIQQELQNRAEHFLRGLIIDLDNDHNTVGTAKRIAKMYMKEVFKGRYLPAPEVTDFPNAKGLDEMYTSGPITVRSACSHHFVPILGHCWIGIVPGDRVIGLSKFNRIVEWIASRGQIQEEMTVQIADFIEKQIQPKGLAVVIRATHECMVWRGVKETSEAAMTTSVMRGVFRDKPEARAEFFSLANMNK